MPTELEKLVKLTIPEDIRLMILAFIVDYGELAYQYPFLHVQNFIKDSLFDNSDETLCAVYRHIRTSSPEETESADIVTTQPPRPSLISCLLMNSSAETAVTTFFEKTLCPEVGIQLVSFTCQGFVQLYRNELWQSLPKKLQESDYSKDLAEQLIAESSRLHGNKNQTLICSNDTQYSQQSLGLSECKWYEETSELELRFIDLLFIIKIQKTIASIKTITQNPKQVIANALNNPYALARLSFTGKIAIIYKLSEDYADVLFQPTNPFSVALDLKCWASTEILKIASVDPDFREAVITAIEAGSPIVLGNFTGEDYVFLVETSGDGNNAAQAICGSTALYCMTEAELVTMVSHWHNHGGLAHVLRHNAIFISRFKNTENFITVIVKLSPIEFLNALKPQDENNPSALMTCMTSTPSLWHKIGERKIIFRATELLPLVEETAIHRDVVDQIRRLSLEARTSLLYNDKKIIGYPNTLVGEPGKLSDNDCAEDARVRLLGSTSTQRNTSADISSLVSKITFTKARPIIGVSSIAMSAVSLWALDSPIGAIICLLVGIACLYPTVKNYSQLLYSSGCYGHFQIGTGDQQTTLVRASTPA